MRHRDGRSFQTVPLQGQLRHQLLEFYVPSPERLYLLLRSVPRRVPGQPDAQLLQPGRLLPLLVNRTRKVAELIPQLYLHGLSEGDFDLAVWGLLGEEVPVSASTVARLKDKWNEELAQWRARPIHMPRFGPWQKCWAGVCVELTSPCLMAV